MEEAAPNIEPHPWPSEPACDHFDAEKLSDQWHFIRTPRTAFYSLSERPGFLRLQLRPERLEEICNPSFIGRPQRHINFAARTAFEFAPKTEFESAGLVLLQNNDNHFRFVIQGNQLHLIERRKGEEQILGSKALSSRSLQNTSRFNSVPRIYLKVEARGQEYSFYAASSPESWESIAENTNGRVLSTQVAGGFVGAHIGLYATSNGQQSENAADFDYFEYTVLPGVLR
jgi:alpha-N-arabinofuranosidase